MLKGVLLQRIIKLVRIFKVICDISLWEKGWNTRF